MSQPIEDELRAAGVELRAGKSGKIRAARLAAGMALERPQWRQLASLPDLVRLEAAGAEVRDEHAALLAELPRLAQLDLSNTSIGDQSLEHLSRCQSLQLLNLSGVDVTPEAIKQLRQRLLGCRIVRL